MVPEVPLMTRPIPPVDTPKPSGGLQTIRRVLPYLWPEGQGWVKRRVVLSLVMLVMVTVCVGAEASMVIGWVSVPRAP